MAYTLTLYYNLLNTIKLQNFMDIKKPQLVKVEAFAYFLWLVLQHPRYIIVNAGSLAARYSAIGCRTHISDSVFSEFGYRPFAVYEIWLKFAHADRFAEARSTGRAGGMRRHNIFKAFIRAYS